MARIKHYLTFQQVPETLQKEIVHFFDYLWETGETEHHSMVFDQLPNTLTVQLGVALKQKMISKVTLFQTCPPAITLAVILKLEAQITIPQEWVLVEGMPGTSMYFVRRGKLDVCKTSGIGRLVTYSTHGAGSYFGESSFFTDLPRQAGVLSV